MGRHRFSKYFDIGNYSKTNGYTTKKGNVAGHIFERRYSVTIPLINIQNKLSLRFVRAITGLSDADEWDNLIILGMNVLDHCSFKIDRTQIPGTFECYESLTSTVEGSSRPKFDHLFQGDKYLLIDDIE